MDAGADSDETGENAVCRDPTPATAGANDVSLSLGAELGSPGHESLAPTPFTHFARVGAIAVDAVVHQSQQTLPPSPKPNFTWGSLPGEDFVHSIDAAYAEVVTWRRNLFNISSGQNGKAFVAEVRGYSKLMPVR